MREIFKSADFILLNKELGSEGKSIGFIPTMGALHRGHLDLIKQAKELCDFVVCSIFVNPLQFNNSEDFEKYPSTIKEDLILLNKYGCDCTFIPDREDVFPEMPNLNYDFGSLSVFMEGEFRPNHFNGMAAVVEKLFRIINPNMAFFGEKDYQQLAIVRWLVEEKNMSIEVIPCETVREESGLAMSSRNLRLTKEERILASEIYKVMLSFKKNYFKINFDLNLKNAINELALNFSVEYFIVANEETLLPLNSNTKLHNPRLFVSTYLSGVRLIDNMSLID
jgi:pantoate--beta-alanine ligase